MKHVLRILGISFLAFIGAISLSIVYESAYANAATANDSVNVSLIVNSGITITDSPDITLSNTIGVSNNTAVGTSTWSVVTTNSLGYFMTIRASTNPAMQSGANQVADFSTTTMPHSWSVSANDARFGFSVFGSDTNASVWGSGTFCNGAATSTTNNSLNYYGFYTTATTTASNTVPTSPTGNNTTVCYAAQQGSSYYIPSGTYTATITATVTTN